MRHGRGPLHAHQAHSHWARSHLGRFPLRPIPTWAHSLLGRFPLAEGTARWRTTTCTSSCCRRRALCTVQCNDARQRIRRSEAVLTLVSVLPGAARRRHVPRADSGGQAEQELLAERAVALTPATRSHSLSARSHLHRSPPRSLRTRDSSIRSSRPLRCGRLCPPERQPPPDRPDGRATSAHNFIRICRLVALRALRFAALLRNWGADDMMLSVKQPPSIPVEPGNDFGRFLLQAPPPAPSRACNPQRAPAHP